MADTDKKKMPIISLLEFYQFEGMPQGITGASITFQRLMEKAVGDMNLLHVSLEGHEERHLEVLDHLEEVGLKHSLDKCQF